MRRVFILVGAIGIGVVVWRATAERRRASAAPPLPPTGPETEAPLAAAPSRVGEDLPAPEPQLPMLSWLDERPPVESRRRRRRARLAPIRPTVVRDGGPLGALTLVLLIGVPLVLVAIATNLAEFFVRWLSAAF